MKTVAFITYNALLSTYAVQAPGDSDIRHFDSLGEVKGWANQGGIHFGRIIKHPVLGRVRELCR